MLDMVCIRQRNPWGSGLEYRITGFVCVSQILRICPKTLLFFICVFLCLRFLVLSVVYYITLSIGVNFMRIQLFAIQKYSQIKRKLDYREKNQLYGISNNLNILMVIILLTPLIQPQVNGLLFNH